MRFNYSIASISLFGVDILLFSKSIQFDAKMFRAKPNDKVELREIFESLYIFLDQHLGNRKILKIFIICNNINKKD